MRFKMQVALVGLCDLPSAAPGARIVSSDRGEEEGSQRPHSSVSAVNVKEKCVLS